MPVIEDFIACRLVIRNGIQYAAYASHGEDDESLIGRRRTVAEACALGAQNAEYWTVYPVRNGIESRSYIVNSW